MTPERWQQIQAVFAAAVERSMDSRGAYLSQVCADDAELRREVESLLASHDSASSRFLKSPAEFDQTEIQATPPPGSRRLSPGARLGTYEILASIGAGGMGEVYRARDTSSSGTSRSRCYPRPSRMIARRWPGSSERRRPSPR